MKLYDSAGRELVNVEFDGRGKETFIARADYLDDGSDVPDYELEEAARGHCLCLCCRESA